jgi:hypothetical protein
VAHTVESYSSHIYFKLIEMYLLYFRMDCKVRAMLSCNEATESKGSSLRDRFEVYRLKKKFEEESAKENLFGNGKFL